MEDIFLYIIGWCVMLIIIFTAGCVVSSITTEIDDMFKKCFNRGSEKYYRRDDAKIHNRRL